MAIRVFLADDQALVRSGFRMLIDSEDDLEVVGEAPDGAQAVRALLADPADVVLMDIRMPVMDGVEATRRIVEARLGTKVLVLTTFDLDEYAFAALKAGASGFLLKDAPADELVRAVRVVRVVCLWVMGGMVVLVVRRLMLWVLVVWVVRVVC